MSHSDVNPSAKNDLDPYAASRLKPATGVLRGVVVGSLLWAIVVGVILALKG